MKTLPCRNYVADGKNLLVILPVARSNQLVISGTQLHLLTGTLDTVFLISSAMGFWARVNVLCTLVCFVALVTILSGVIK